MDPRHRLKGVLAVLTGAALLLLGTVQQVEAQATGTVQGQVIDAASLRPLTDAQISIPGTGRGMLTSSQGRFLLLNVPVGQTTVRVQLIGYETAEEAVTVSSGGTSTVDFQLSTTALAMDELVVTGVGQATQRRQLSTSVNVINAQAIAEAPVATLDQLLQGRVAGATVNAVSSQPGTGSLINFRGVSSVFGAQTPVIYIDGVRVDNSQATAAGTGGEQSSALAELLTSDIERIEITKGGAASTLYGSDAATGVIQIFTKQGTPGAPRFTARMEQGIDQAELKYILDAGVIYPDDVAAGELAADFLAQEFFRTGHAQSYSLGVNGGSESVTYNMSGRVSQSDGVQPKNENAVYNLRGGMEASLSDRLRVNFSGAYTRSNFDRIYNGAAIADPITAMEVGDAMFFSGQNNVPDALEMFLRPDIAEEVNRFIFGTGIQYQASDIFSARVNGGIDHRNNRQRQFQPIGFVPGEITGQLTHWQRQFTSVTLDAAGTFSYPNEGTVTSNLTIGAQGFRDDVTRVAASGTGFALPGTKDFGEAADVSATENNSQLFNGGLYVDETLGIGGRLFVNAGFRLDAGSTFGDEVETALYPKAGLSYAVSDEEFFQNVLGNWVDEFRFRAAYGETGKFPPPFLRDQSFSAIPFRGEAAPRFSNPGNEDLKPEVTKTFEAGFDAALLNNRIGLDLTYYDAQTEDALFFVPEPPLSGQGTQIRNVGEISNSGIELEVNAQVLNRRSLAWSVGATYQTNTNEVVSMGGAAPFFVESQKRVEEGRPVGAWFVTTPFDSNGDGLLNGSEQRFTGKSPTPTKSGSLNTRVTLFDRLHVSALADWAGGHEVMDFGSVWSTFNGIYRREIVDEGYTFPIRHNAAGVAGRRYSQGAARSEFIYEGDWWKLREIAVRYTLPDEWAARMGAERGSLFGSARNVHIWSKNPLIDPELNGLSGGGLALGGESSITISPPRSFRFGVEFTF
ncbi:MAG: TonB-dependent receptor [Gemmatimonadota bacterium]